jgi:hypothetical protein
VESCEVRLFSIARCLLMLQVDELGVKADFADDVGYDDDDLDDLLEESEDPWMREPAGVTRSHSSSGHGTATAHRDAESCRYEI